MENVRYFISENDTIADDTRVILESMACVPGVVRPIVALPDLHFKYSYHTPTGVVVMTRNVIIPKFVNANCGMSFVRTGLYAKDLTEERLNKLFGILRSGISVSTRTRPVISPAELKKIVEEGAGWTFSRFGLDGEDLANFENGGNIFGQDRNAASEAMRFVPSFCARVGLLSLGVLGYGNHFIELGEVDELIDPHMSGKFGISREQLCFMIHGDSRAFGQSLADLYSKKAKRFFGLQQLYKNAHYRVLASPRAPLALKNSFNALNFYLNRAKSVFYWKADKLNRKTPAAFGAIDANSAEGKAYLAATCAAVNFGYANRAYMSSVARDALREVFGLAKARVKILHDGNHDVLQKEKINGEELLAHRNGAAMAVPGRTVLLPSALGRHSYLCVATAGAASSYYSVCHGVGRKIDRGEARLLFSPEELFSAVKRYGMKIYDYGKGKAQEEDSRAFRDIEEVLGAVRKYDIARPIARLRPIAALKGWR